MPGEHAFTVEGVVVKAISDRLYRVVLPNGHELLGFVPGKRQAAKGSLSPNDKVTLAVSPFDLSRGRIVFEK